MSLPTPVREAFVGAAGVARGLVASRRTAKRWNEPSALAELTVGALAAHLARSVLLVAEFLDAAPAAPGSRLETGAEYFVSRGVEPTLDAPLNVQIRERAAAGAHAGPEALVASFDMAFRDVAGRLATEPIDRTVVVSGAVPMLLDEYLATRIVELVVHSDDLAVSLGETTEPFSPVALAVTVGCLLEMARLRHGDLAVIRGLARRERDVVDALRVL